MLNFLQNLLSQDTVNETTEEKKSEDSPKKKGDMPSLLDTNEKPNMPVSRNLSDTGSDSDLSISKECMKALFGSKEDLLDLDISSSSSDDAMEGKK